MEGAEKRDSRLILLSAPYWSSGGVNREKWGDKSPTKRGVQWILCFAVYILILNQYHSLPLIQSFLPTKIKN